MGRGLLILRVVFVLLVLNITSLNVVARIWTNKEGQKVNASVVKVEKDRQVVLRNTGGKTFKVPFDTFVENDVEYLETLLNSSHLDKLHPVSWEKMNELFGLNIWKDPSLWDDVSKKAAKRMKLKPESKTDFMENFRAYQLGRKKVLGEPIYTTALYGDKEHVVSMSLVFLNAGDIPIPQDGKINYELIEKMIEKCGETVLSKVESVLGEATRDSLGKGDLREKVWRWDWNEHAIMLSLQEGKYVVIRMMPTERADRAGRVGKLKEKELKERMASCVERRDNGDVIIGNIPMINQGPKGYCSPATWERYLRYMEIPADMYLLALAANTGVGGGTYISSMIEATSSLISSNGRELRDARGEMETEEIAEYIDQGLPVMWSFKSTPDFQFAATNNTRRRKGKKLIERNQSGQDEDNSSGGHICLIIGYNKETNEVAISDSWGPSFAERWVKIDVMQDADTYNMKVIMW